MSYFSPVTQRTMFAVVTASAIGSGCYAWMSKTGRTTISDPKTSAAGLATLSQSFGWKSVSCAAEAKASEAVSHSATAVAMGAGGSDASSLKPLIVSGPSGVGKGTLINMLLKDFPGRFGFSVSHTTRAPRPGEVNGTHYHFSEKAVMQEEIDANKFIEHANVHGNLYGTSIAAVQSVTADSKICVLDIDIQGVKSVRNADSSVLDPHYLFIAAPSMDVLEARLRGRGTETEAQVAKRLANSKAEMEYGTESGNFEKVLVNDGLEAAYAELKETAKGWYPQLREHEDQAAANPSSA